MINIWLHPKDADGETANSLAVMLPERPAIGDLIRVTRKNESYPESDMDREQLDRNTGTQDFRVTDVVWSVEVDAQDSQMIGSFHELHVECDMVVQNGSSLAHRHAANRSD